MKLSLSISAIADYFGFEEAMKRVSRAGFNAVDYDRCKYQYDLHGGVYNYSEKEFTEYFKEQRKYADKYGIEIAQFHAPYPTYSKNKEEFDHMVRSIERAITASEILGCPVMEMHGAQRCDWDPDDDPAETKKLNMCIFEKLVPQAEKAGVVIALENLPCEWITTGTPYEVIDFIDTVNSPYFGACLDTGHSNMNNVKPVEFARMLGSRLKALHLHDNREENDSHYTPMLGTVKWKDLMKTLAEIGYKGAYSLETDGMYMKYPPDFVDELLNFEIKVLKHIVSLAD